MRWVRLFDKVRSTLALRRLCVLFHSATRLIRFFSFLILIMMQLVRNSLWFFLKKHKHSTPTLLKSFRGLQKCSYYIRYKTLVRVWWADSPPFLTRLVHLFSFVFYLSSIFHLWSLDSWIGNKSQIFSTIVCRQLLPSLFTHSYLLLVDVKFFYFLIWSIEATNNVH